MLGGFEIWMKVYMRKFSKWLQKKMQLDIRDEDSLYTSIEVIDGKVQTSSAGSEAGIGIRLLIDGVLGFAYGSKEHYNDVFQMALIKCTKNIKEIIRRQGRTCSC